MQMHIQEAPGDLEAVRRFINTWSIPNQTRIETDVLAALISDPEAWEREVSNYPLHPGDSLDTLLALRLSLRRACADHSADSDALNPWFRQIPLRAQVASAEGETNIQLHAMQNTYAGHLIAIVANAYASAHWSRLKTCGDCQWAFYDHTRNANKRWCGMTKGGPAGRACGTIAKVSAYRARKAGQAGGSIG